MEVGGHNSPSVPAQSTKPGIRSCVFPIGNPRSAISEMPPMTHVTRVQRDALKLYGTIP